MQLNYFLSSPQNRFSLDIQQFPLNSMTNWYVVVSFEVDCSIEHS
jgi:hypothetical protein